MNPNGLKVNGSEATLVAIDQNKIRYLSVLNRTEDDPEGNYTCLVKNNCGNVTGNVIFVIPSMRPKILRIQPELNSSTSWGLLCEAKAKPSPTITWINPHGHKVNGSEATLVAIDQNKIRYLSFLKRTEDDPEGNYSCLVKNIHGTARAYILYEGSGRNNPQIIFTVVAWSTSLCLFLLLVTIGICIYRKKWKPQEGRASRAGTSNIHDQDQSDDKIYMGLAKTSHIPESQVYERIGN
uniref:disorganized muscle protein 1-like isoform X2 n=1 Tax=Myxine glutinosa TaxID=7769 RepID=UPI00358FEBB0